MKDNKLTSGTSFLLLSRYILLIVSVIFITACKKDKTELGLSFLLQYQNEPLVMLQDYQYPDGRKIQFTRVSFFLSELRVSDGSESVEITDVDFINLTESHATATKAADGYQYVNDEVDLDQIDEISFNLGLTESQNQTVPADHPAGSPLAKPGEYWVAWDSYIFVKIEGWIDLDDDGQVETGIALHLGSDQVMRPILVQTNQPANDLTLAIDLHQVFQGSDIYDIAANPQLHSLSQLPAAIELADNLQNSLTLINKP